MFSTKLSIKNRLVVALVLPLFLTIWTLKFSSILFYILYSFVAIAIFATIGKFTKNFIFQEGVLTFTLKFGEKTLYKKVIKQGDVSKVSKKLKGYRFTKRMVLKNGGYYDLKQFEKKDGFNESLENFLQKENQALDK